MLIDAQRDRPCDEQGQLFAFIRAKRPDEHQLHGHPEQEHERRDQQDGEERVDVEHGEG